MNYTRGSFSVGSPGTKDYADAHDRIFRCAKTGELKSICACCKTTETTHDKAIDNLTKKEP